MNKRTDITIPLLAVLLLFTVFMLARFWMLFLDGRTQKDEATELISLSNSVLHDNNTLIRTINVYVLSQDESYKERYYELLEDYDSFYGRLDRMEEIGLTDNELDLVNQMKDIWNVLETIETIVLYDVELDLLDEAIAILYSAEYLEADAKLVDVMTQLIDSIEERSSNSTMRINRQYEIAIVIFSLIFFVIALSLAVMFRRNEKLREQYKEQKEQAELSSRTKSAFLANVSHEIRTPMNAILGVTEMQLLHGGFSEEIKNAFLRVYESGNLLLNIINDILDLSKIEAGKLDILPAKYEVPSLLNDAIQLNRLRYETKALNLVIEIDQNTPLNLIGDELRIKQVLNNVLSNAFKYTNNGSITISVSVQSTGDIIERGYALSMSAEPLVSDVILVISITDTGPGMTEEQLGMLFSEYTRFNLEANRATSGTGLGMSITKNLIDLMNGKIDVSSQPGKGSTFTVSIPQKRVDDMVCGPDMAKKLSDFELGSSIMSKKGVLIRNRMPYGSVLVVDDVESNLYVAKSMLMPYELKIDTVNSGFGAVDKVKNGNVYDIIFMDHMMPDMDGIETLNILRDMGYKGFIVALTANALVGQAEVFLQKGFDGYLAKPIDSRELNLMLNELIRNKKPFEVVEAAMNGEQIEDNN